MERILSILICIIAIQTMTMARTRMLYERINTGNAELDSILINLNKQTEGLDKIGKLSLNVYIKGESHGVKLGRAAKYLPNTLPFETHEGITTAIESFCRISYQAPCKLQITPLQIRSNNKSGKRILKESSQALLPFYTLKASSTNNIMVFPFSKDGLEQYNFKLKETEIPTKAKDDRTEEEYGLTKKEEVLTEEEKIIEFTPKREHHTLGKGFVIIDSKNNIKALSFAGRVDFGRANYLIGFDYNDSLKVIIPKKSHVSISYYYSGSTGVNDFDCYFDFNEIAKLDKSQHKTTKLDLTDIYDHALEETNLDSIRPFPLSTKEDSLLNNVIIRTKRERNLFQKLPEKLVGSNNINAFGTDLKVYGPLYPASIGYDRINGVTLRERLRWSHLYQNGKSIIIKPDIGYSFKMKELRYKFSAEWTYAPRLRGALRFVASNRSSEFSSKFKNDIDAILKDSSNLKYKDLDLKFKDLGIDYYERHEFKLEHAIELRNGLMFYAGAIYNYRNPVKYGVHKMSQERVDELIDNYYADFDPFIRLTWTPRQYYHYSGNQKLYIASYYPTFSFEFAKGIDNVLGAKSNYSRAEIDVQHTIKLNNQRILSYHVGGGSFFKQKGEYFINYTYFSRNQFPTTWDDNIGGIFNLLDDYWYNTSPGYIQMHVMFESPFMLLHLAKPISKYVIKERVYASHLWADGKNAYTEYGYGMGNNYFNIGVFAGFIGLKNHEIGIKASIEIDSHW